MRLNGKVKKYLHELFETQGFAHLSLIDPDPAKVDLNKLSHIVKALDEGGTSGFMVGGSTAFDRDFLDAIIDTIKEASNKPVILFPGNIAGVSRKADAIFFLSPFNSTNHYYLIRAQAIAAPVIKMWKLEVISLAYLLFEPGGAAAYVCEAQPIPRNKPEIAVAFASAAELFGFDMVYLEAGSGASSPIPTNVVKAVSSFVSIPVVVGGGIRTPSQAAEIISAGAKVVVQGTRYEEYISEGNYAKVKRILSETINAMKQAARR